MNTGRWKRWLPVAGLLVCIGLTVCLDQLCKARIVDASGRPKPLGFYKPRKDGDFTAARQIAPQVVRRKHGRWGYEMQWYGQEARTGSWRIFLIPRLPASNSGKRVVIMQLDGTIVEDYQMKHK